MILTGTVGLTDAIGSVVSAATSFLPILMKEPVIYFVAAGLVSAAAAIVGGFIGIKKGGRRK